MCYSAVAVTSIDSPSTWLQKHDRCARKYLSRLPIGQSSTNTYILPGGRNQCQFQIFSFPLLVASAFMRVPLCKFFVCAPTRLTIFGCFPELPKNTRIFSSDMRAIKCIFSASGFTVLTATGVPSTAPFVTTPKLPCPRMESKSRIY